MFRLKHKNTKRIVTAICLLLTFTFMSLYATYQNGKGFDAAYADSSSNNCTQWIAACVAAGAVANAICSEYPNSKACRLAYGRAALICSEIQEACF